MSPRSRLRFSITLSVLFVPLSGIAYAQPVPTAPPSTAAVSLVLPSAEDLVKRNLQARGGVERLRAVQAVRLEGQLTLPDGQEVPTTIYMKRPSLIRQEVTIQGRRLVQAFDGRRGWAINPMMGGEPIEVPAEVAARMAEQADFDGPLLDWQAKGHRLEVVGLETVGGVQAARLRLVKRSGEVQHLFLDLERGLEVMSQGVVEQAGQRVTVESRYSDFRTVDGVTLPFVVEVSADGRTQQRIVLTRVEFLASVDEGLFRFGAR